MYFSILICLKVDLVILCFFCSRDNVQTNVAGSFLCLIDKHFPESHVLHEIFNRNNVKVSYSFMNNMTRVIMSQNKKILGKDDASPANNNKCNCKKKDLCCLDGVYKATVTSISDNARVFIGMTEHSFKTRFSNHKVSLKHPKHSHATVLSKYIWDLKDNNIDFSIKWSIIIT